MSNHKIITPYQRLMNVAKDYVASLRRARREKVEMFYMEKGNSYDVSDIYERTIAAQQLGYHIEIYAEKGKIYVSYVKDIDVPYEINSGVYTF